MAKELENPVPRKGYLLRKRNSRVRYRDYDEDEAKSSDSIKSVNKPKTRKTKGPRSKRKSRYARREPLNLLNEPHSEPPEQSSTPNHPEPPEQSSTSNHPKPPEQSSTPNNTYINIYIFLRNLIRVAGMCLDGVRYHNLCGEDVYDGKLQIQLKFHPETRILTIRDNGVGWTEDGLSETFGQRAVCLKDCVIFEGWECDILDRLEVTSKHSSSVQHVWMVSLEEGVTIFEDAVDDPLQGTEVRLYVKEEAVDHFTQDNLSDLVNDFALLINFPICVWVTKHSWVEYYNEHAIWLRSPKEVTPSYYIKFFYFLSRSRLSHLHAVEDPIIRLSHTSDEAKCIDFKALLFIPSRPLFSRIDVYVKGVYAPDLSNDDLLPTYLRFVMGVVDSSSLRPGLSDDKRQACSFYKEIKEKLCAAVLEMIQGISREDNDTVYSRFWKVYGELIRKGVIDDVLNRSSLAEFLRFESSHSDGELVSLNQYCRRMKGEQEVILYVSGLCKKGIQSCPLLEMVQKQGYEVFYFEYSTDENVVKSLGMYRGFKFLNVSNEPLHFLDVPDSEEGSKEPLHFPDVPDSEERSKEPSESEDVTKHLTDWWIKVLEPQDVDSVKLQDLPDNIPCRVETSLFKKVFTINHGHAVIQNIHNRVSTDRENLFVKKMATLLYEYALTSNGFLVTDYKAFAEHIFESVKAALNISTIERPSSERE